MDFDFEVSDFDLSQTLECGQCFRFTKLDEDEYIFAATTPLGVSDFYVAKYQKNGKFEGKLYLSSFDKNGRERTLSDEEKLFLRYYFDLDRAYGRIKKEIVKSSNLLKSAVSDYGGIHLLNQYFPETLISFAISQNKQIPQIKQVIANLCKNYGEYISEYKGNEIYTFPNTETLKEITKEEFKNLKAGFRDKYLVAASDYLYNLGLYNNTFHEDVLFKNILNLQSLPYDDLKANLKSIKGVGDKVANCVLLFGLGKREAFPVDVWIKRGMEELYFNGEKKDISSISDFAKKTFKEYGGYAQQYIFMASRKKV